jgi:hypothetical protein
MNPPDLVSLRLADFAHARSGDKADRVDIGLFAWDEAGYAALERLVTRARVAAHCAHLLAVPGVESVHRYELPQLLALKFVLDGALDGGAARSLRSDNLGKTVGALLLRMTVDVPAAEAAVLRAGTARALASF